MIKTHKIKMPVVDVKEKVQIIMGLKYILTFC